jgi:hypothetical protein|tara:strand:- start:146 stop:409 length:264 start_codon:yes stop_codon:yes gene_type:complete
VTADLIEHFGGVNMRELKLNEDEFRILKKSMELLQGSIQTSRSTLDAAVELYKISEEDYFKVKKVVEKIEGIKRVRVRYDKTKTEKY